MKHPRIHAICPALNEEVFIGNTLRALYPYCSGISVLTQYDRDWYGKPVRPDRTIQIVADFPDPEGKIQLVLRRWRDQAAALNCEMAAVASRAHRGVGSHGSTAEQIRALHDAPDYFLIVDADEIYDSETLPRVIDYVMVRRPRAARVHGYNYLRSWNRRVPREVVRFCHFGFVRTGLRFEHIREITWSEHRLSKALRVLRLPDFSARLFGFITVPPEVGHFHHGCWLGDNARLAAKARKSAHTWVDTPGFIPSVDQHDTIQIPTSDLPRNIREAEWPEGWIEREARGSGC